MADRLPTQLEIAAIRRLAESRGGSAMVLAKGDADAGSILLLTMNRGADAQYWERMPQLNGGRAWAAVPEQTTEKYEDYGRSRHDQDPDLWVLEVDIADPGRFAAILPQ